MLPFQLAYRYTYAVFFEPVMGTIRNFCHYSITITINWGLAITVTITAIIFGTSIKQLQVQRPAR